MSSLRNTTVVRDSPVVRGGKLTLSLMIKGHWLDPDAQRQHVTAYVLAAIAAHLAGDEEQADAWLEDARAMAVSSPGQPGDTSCPGVT